MAPHYGSDGQLTRDERVQLCGIDCEDQLIWHDWTPGVEAVMDLTLRNVALVTQKVKFVLPPTQEFDMPYPEPFKLAPGMKKSIPISFRPSRYEPHVDKVQIITKGASFFITVKAVVKDIALTLPPFIDFGMCPTAEKSECTIDVYNTGDLKASLRWHAKAPFSVRAPTNVIEVGQAIRCSVAFDPQDASVYDGHIACEALTLSDTGSHVNGSTDGRPAEAMDSKRQYILQCTGVGKIPHLAVLGTKEPVVQFGEVFPGNRAPQTLEITNTTQVRATFRVTAVNDDGAPAPLAPQAFSVSPESGVVEPGRSFALTFYFHSHTVKEHTCQRFQITSPGGTPLVVTCTAFCRPMEVRLSTRSHNFGEVLCGKTYTRTIQIHNDSDRPAVYHFINADYMRGVFWLDRHMGIVPPASFMVVTVYFGPLTPINFYKALTCIIKGAMAPLTLHLLGSAYTDKSRPAKLEQHHIDMFKSMQLKGIREYPPPEERKKPEDGDMDEDVPDFLERTRNNNVQNVEVSATAGFLEAMLPMDSTLRDVVVSPGDIDFGSCTASINSEKHVVTITNRTSQKVNVAWMLPGETRMPCIPDEKSRFSVYPVTCDIKAKGQADFTVSFKAQAASNYEGEVLEAVVSQRINRSFRLVDLANFTPPWTIALGGIGHTMGGTRNDPRLDLSESNVRFRACTPGERTYQVVVFTNPGDTCIAYRILSPVDVGNVEVDVDKLGELKVQEVPFSAWPVQGTIPPHQFNLVILEFAPTIARNENAFNANFQIVVDYNEAHPKTLRVAGRCWDPRVSFCKGQPTLTFPPTCSGIASSILCPIKNVSEIPVKYHCQIPSRFRSLFWFQDSSGELAPSESRSIQAFFCPNSDKAFSAPLYCSAACIEDPDNAVLGPLQALVKRPAATLEEAPAYKLQFVGHGRGPALSLEPDMVDLGAVMACDEVKASVTILNSSSLMVYFGVVFEHVFQADGPSTTVAEEALHLEHAKTVAGRCTETLSIFFKPLVRGVYEYQIILTPQAGDGKPCGRPIVLSLRANVQFPSVQIADLRTECVTTQPQSMMWTQFQVDGVNELYLGEVTDVERRFQNAIGIDEKKKLVKQLKPFQLLFGTSAAGSAPTVVYLVLKNPTNLGIRFSFQFPRDLNLEHIPSWCDEKALIDDREAHFTWVEEHEIYDIQPRSGEIAAGDHMHIKMTYNHHSIGTHILPVVFNVHDGRSILMYLKSHSVAPTVGCLSIRSSVVTLQPVPLNVEKGSAQPVELTNSGCVGAPWRIDLDTIEDFNRENHNFEVLSVSPCEGVLQPRCSTFIHFTFRPLEAKRYACPVRIEMLKDGRPMEELCFELQADGYEPESQAPQVEPTFPLNLPIQTYAPVPGCGAALSIEMLDFGQCPLASRASRMLVLVNYSSEHVLSFRWEQNGLFQKPSDMEIEPSTGELSPGSYCIIVFRLCSSDPIDISGEVACALDWIHIADYGKDASLSLMDKVADQPEFLAFHSDHVHEPIRTGKAFLGDANRMHISVAHRLTVSRFRNLMSSAAGQKFLNENLHRTAVLSSDISAMATRRTNAQNKSSASTVERSQASMGGAAGGGTQEASTVDVQRPSGPPPPKAFPLTVRIRAVVADWGLGQDRRDEFLVAGPWPVDPATKQDDDWQNRTNPKVSWLGDAAANNHEPAEALHPGLLGGILEHIVREVMEETDFDEILDNIMMQDTPNFIQYDDAAPPGGPERTASHTVAELQARDPGAMITDAPETAADAEVAPQADAAKAEVCAALEAALVGSEDSARDEVHGAGHGPASGEGGGMPSSTGSGDVDPSSSSDDNPQRYWDEAVQDYGEVDLDAFKGAAGEVLDKMLLDLMDDVVAGRLNWLRPVPRIRRRG